MLQLETAVGWSAWPQWESKWESYYMYQQQAGWLRTRIYSYSAKLIWKINIYTSINKRFHALDGPRWPRAHGVIVLNNGPNTLHTIAMQLAIRICLRPADFLTLCWKGNEFDMEKHKSLVTENWSVSYMEYTTWKYYKSVTSDNLRRFLLVNYFNECKHRAMTLLENKA